MPQRPQKLKRRLRAKAPPKPKIKTKPGNIVSGRNPIKMFVNKPDSVFIVGGGPSLRGFDFKRLEGCDTIASNKAVFDVPNPKFFVTMDFTFLKKMKGMVSYLKHYPYLTKCFVAAMGGNLVEKDGKLIDKKFNLTYDLSAFDLIIKSYQKDEMGFTFKDFRNGENSGFCALQLAIIMGYKNIFLLGMDLTANAGATHYHDCYNNSRGNTSSYFSTQLNKYLAHFKNGIKCAKLYRPNLNIISCSPISKLNSSIKYVSINEVLKK